MKICPKCNQHKKETEFGSDRKRPDGISCHCSECKRQEGRARYYANPDPFKDRSKKARSSRRSESRMMISNIKRKYGCRSCGEKEECVLEFHHFKNRKDSDGVLIGKAALVGPGRLISEINKCVVLCANCHKKVHAGLININDSHLCKEVFLKKKRIFERSKQLKSCSIFSDEDNTWVVKFGKPHSVLDRVLVLKDEQSKAVFSAASRVKIAPKEWCGDPKKLPPGWMQDTLKNIRRCPLFFYEKAVPFNGRSKSKKLMFQVISSIKEVNLYVGDDGQIYGD